MHRALAAMIVVAIGASACAGSDSTGEGAAETGGGIVVEGIERDTREADDGVGDDDTEPTGAADDTEPTGAADDDPVVVTTVPALPDIDDLVLDEPEFVFEVTGDPCADLLGIIIAPDAAAVAELSDEQQQDVFAVALGPFGEDATSTLQRMIEADDMMSNDEILDLITEFDAVTLEPCGWPLFGALSIVSEASAVRFCSVEGAIGDGEVEPVAEEPACSEPSVPDVLPCFEAIAVDPDSIVSISRPWLPVDCETGVEVEWDRFDEAWLDVDREQPDRFQPVDIAIG